MKTYNSICPEIKLRKPSGEVLKAKIQSSQNAADYFRAIFDESTLEIREESLVIYMNNASNTVGWFRVSVGGLCSTVVDVRLILKQALQCNAVAMILAHNHPSGVLKASQQDIAITNKLKQAAALFDINLIDHIILTADTHYSLMENGLM